MRELKKQMLGAMEMREPNVGCLLMQLSVNVLFMTKAIGLNEYTDFVIGHISYAHNENRIL